MSIRSGLALGCTANRNVRSDTQGSDADRAKYGSGSIRGEGSMSGTTYRMNSSQVQAFLDAPRHAIAAALRPNGAPQLSPIWFLYENERLVEAAKQIFNFSGARFGVRIF